MLQQKYKRKTKHPYSDYIANMNFQEDIKLESQALLRKKLVFNFFTSPFNQSRSMRRKPDRLTGRNQQTL